MADKNLHINENGHADVAGELGKALQELAKGEKTAAALESQLDSMEAKIEALLAQAERDQQAVEQNKKQTNGVSSAGRADEKKGKQ